MNKSAPAVALAAVLCALSGSGGVPNAAADSAPRAWDCIQDQAGFIGHWEIQIDGDFSEFVYSRDLYPGNQPIRVALTHVEVTPGAGTVAFASDQAELTIHLGQQPTGVCPVYGEKCEPATLEKLSVPGVGPRTSQELTEASWACAPKATPRADPPDSNNP